MEINKQLFEDVLSGKLKGTFIQENGKKLNSKLLTDINKFTVVINEKTFYFNGKPTNSYYDGILNIIDFIVDLESYYTFNEKDKQFVKYLNGSYMEENELTIEIPEGKIVDWDESKKQNKIVLKDKQLTYDDVAVKLFHNKKFYATSERGDIKSIATSVTSECLDANNATTQYQLECILAKNKLANVATYLNDGWEPELTSEAWYHVLYLRKGLNIAHETFEYAYTSSRIVFKSEELAQQAIEILGEETVKLALEPLGI